MRRGRSRILAVAALAALAALSVGLLGCTESSDESASNGPRPVTLEQVAGPNGADLHRVTLTANAVKRLGLRTERVADQAGTKVVPYGAVVYDGHGAAWVYTRSRPRSFVRAQIIIQSSDGENVLLTAGPDIGTQVVTVGTPELFGAEHGIGA